MPRSDRHVALRLAIERRAWRNDPVDPLLAATLAATVLPAAVRIVASLFRVRAAEKGKAITVSVNGQALTILDEDDPEKQARLIEDWLDRAEPESGGRSDVEFH